MSWSRDLRMARPSMITLSPLRHWLVLGFSVFNICLGLLLGVQPKPVHPLYVYTLADQKVWGGIFIFFGIMLAAGLILNAWKFMKWVLFVGSLIKALFAYSLVVLGFDVGFTAVGSVTVVWLMIMYTQFILYIYFAPVIPEKKG